jgi:FKBP-type peptidyl-prolyl cis-trans isomerase SlpA
MEIGDRKSVTIAPEDAYGSIHEQLSHTVSRADFASDPYVGGMVNLISPDGVELVGRITAVEDDEITLDFNHPLAGERLTFEIEVVAIDAGESPIVGA